MTASPAGIWLQPIADDVRRRAKSLRKIAKWEEARMLQNRELAGVLDAVAAKLADGEITPELLRDAVRAAHPPDRFGLRLPGEEPAEDEATALRRIFGISAP